MKLTPRGLSHQQEADYLSDLLTCEDLPRVLAEIQKRDPNGIWTEFTEDGEGYDPPTLVEARDTLRDWIADLQS
jgi:hypothetical protein